MNDVSGTAILRIDSRGLECPSSRDSRTRKSKGELLVAWSRAVTVTVCQVVEFWIYLESSSIY